MQTSLWRCTFSGNQTCLLLEACMFYVASHLHTVFLLSANHLHLEGDSSMAIRWIQGSRGDWPAHSILCDIWDALGGCVLLDVRHVYWVANRVADWAASYMVENSSRVLCTDRSSIPIKLRNICFLILLDVLILEGYESSTTPKKSVKHSCDALVIMNCLSLF